MKLLKNEDLRRYQAPVRHFQGCRQLLVLLSAMVVGFVPACGGDAKDSPRPKIPRTGVFALKYGWLPAGIAPDIGGPAEGTQDGLIAQSVWCDTKLCARPEGFVRRNATGPDGLTIAAVVEYLNLDSYQQHAVSSSSVRSTGAVWGTPAEVATASESTSLDRRAERSIVWGIGQRRFRVIATASKVSQLPTESALVKIATSLGFETMKGHIAIRLAHETLTVGAQQGDYDLMYSPEDRCLFVQDSLAPKGRASGRCGINFSTPGYSTAPVPVRGGGLGTLVYGWAAAKDAPTALVSENRSEPSSVVPKRVRIDGHTFFVTAVGESETVYGVAHVGKPITREWNGPSITDFPGMTERSDATVPVNAPYTLLRTLNAFRLFATNVTAPYQGTPRELFCVLTDQIVNYVGPQQVGSVSLCTPSAAATAVITPEGSTLIAAIGATKNTTALIPLLTSPSAAQIKFPSTAQEILVLPLAEGACVHPELFDAFIDNGHSDRRCAPSPEGQ